MGYAGTVYSNTIAVSINMFILYLMSSFIILTELMLIAGCSVPLLGGWLGVCVGLERIQFITSTSYRRWCHVVITLSDL